MKCILCGTNGSYVGVFKLECPNPDCSNYDGVSKAIPTIRAAWIQVHGSTHLGLYWVQGDLNSGDPVTIVDTQMVRKASPHDYVMGRCTFFKRYHTELEAVDDFHRAFG